jgi:hypothetical protein
MSFKPSDLPHHLRERLGCAIPTTPARKVRGTGKVGTAKRAACAAARAERFGVDAVSVYIPLRTESETNVREHHMKRYRRKVLQQTAVRLYGVPMFAFIQQFGPPFVVTLTRFGKGTMDPGNYEASWKHVQDSVAMLLGVDDGDRARVTWVYAPQVKSSFYAVRIHIAAASAGEL